MKYFFPLLSVALLAVLVSCDKEDELAQFSLSYGSDVVVPTSSGFGFQINLITSVIQSNSDSIFEVNQTRAELIEKIRLRQLELTLDAPADADFSFLESVEAFISAPGLQETYLGAQTSIGSNPGKLLRLNTSTEDVQQYLKAETFTIRLLTTATRVLREDHVIKVNATFLATANN